MIESKDTGLPYAKISKHTIDFKATNILLKNFFTEYFLEFRNLFFSGTVIFKLVICF